MAGAVSSGDPAGGFGDGAAVDHRDRAAQGLRRHVVEQHGVDPDLERLGELVERVDLELDLDEMSGMPPRAFERRPHAPGERDVIVLDQHRVVEAETVVGAAAEANRLLFEGAQARGGLAGADDLRLGVGDRIGQRPRRRRDPGHPAQKIERGALGGKHAARPAADAGDRSPREIRAPSSHDALDAQCRIDELEREKSGIEPGDDARLARRDDRLDLSLLAARSPRS